jgi:hypothetical protein
MGQGLATFELLSVAQDQSRAREPLDFGERRQLAGGTGQLREATRQPHNGETADGHKYP